MRVRAALAVLLMLPGAWAAEQERNQRALPPALRRAIAASNKLRFTGHRTVTVMRDGQPTRHDEIVMRDGPRLRIEFPSKGAYAGQVIVENGKERKHFLPASNEIRILPTRREEGLQRLRAMARNGRITTEPGERVAGIQTIEVVVRDADSNLLQRMAIDGRSGMILRRRVYNSTGTEVGGFVFTKVDLSPERFDPSLFRIERRGVKITTPWDELRKVAARSGFVPVGIPASTGYRLDAVRLVKLPGGPVFLQVYIGPGGRVSLYQLKTAVDPERLRQQARGVVRTLSWSDDGKNFVLLGPHDEATLAKLKAAVGR